ncbi:MAG: aldo/keto reductase [Eggerthellaceae bacterium]
MEYRELGRTGLKVSEIGFGAEWMDKSDEEVAAFVARCEEEGINIVDIWMPDPEIRRKLGDAMAAHGGRDRWVIQGHIGSTWQGGQYVRTRDLDACKKAFEDLLRYLRTDRVELGMIHYIDDVNEFDQVMAGSPYLDYIHELREKGTIEHVGLSTHNPDVALRALAHEDIEMIMFSTNPAFDMMPPSDDVNMLFGDFSEASEDGIDPKRAEVYRLCEREGKGITVMKPYAGGRLLDAEKSPFGIAMTPTQCIQYCFDRPGVVSVLAGYSELSHIDDALAYETATSEQKAYAHVLSEAPKHAYFGHCIYCGHCAPCVAGIDIAMVNKLYDLAVMQEEVPESVAGHYFALDATAADCTGCGSCEERCPFGVKIADQMEKTAALFEG